MEMGGENLENCTRGPLLLGGKSYAKRKLPKSYTTHDSQECSTS